MHVAGLTKPCVRFLSAVLAPAGSLILDPVSELPEGASTLARGQGRYHS